MSAVVYPTVAIGVAGFGGRVVGRIRDSLDRDEPLLRTVRCPAAEVGSELHSTLGSLLQVGQLGGDLTEPRLDLMAFAQGLHGDPDDLARVCDQAARVVGEHYGAMFPADRPPEQRTAVLHLVVAVPPMTAQRFDGMLARLRTVEAWAEGSPPYPLLGRVWLLSLHTRAGELSGKDVERGCAAFGIALLGSGLRDEEVVSQRMAAHRHGEGLFGFLSAASLSLPREKLRGYAATRAVYDGLSTLVTRVEKEADPTVALGAVNALRHDGWIESFEDGEAARRCRQMSAGLAGATGGLPERPVVHAFDEPEAIRDRYPVLFRAATQVKPPTQLDASDLDEMIVALDKAESSALAEIEGGIERLFAGKLGQATGLQELPVVETGLRRVLAGLKDADELDAAAVGGGAVAEDADPLRDELEEALESMPSRGTLLGVAGTLSAVVGSLVIVLGLGLVGRFMDANQFHEDWILRTHVGVWLLGGVLAVAAALIGARLLGTRTRRAATTALQRRSTAVAELWRRGGGGEPGRQAESQLRQRRMRVRRGAIVALERALEHLAAVRQTLIGSRDGARQELRDMGVTAHADGALDDLSGLLGEVRPMHQPLVPVEAASRWVRSCREITDPEVWANRMLESSWPATGLLVDVPCGDPDQLRELGREQAEPLASRNLFSEPFAADAAADTVSAFATNAPLALADPCTPRDEHGDPVRGVRPGRMFAVAPLDGRGALDTSFESCPVDLPVLWTGSRMERVIVVRTWEGFRAVEIARGAGLDP